MTVAVTRMPWEVHAACRGSEAGLFMPPIRGETADVRCAREQTAKEICVRYPVLAECLDYALRVQEPIGIWGGLNESQRRCLIASTHR